jgi:hypothetical protein
MRFMLHHHRWYRAASNYRKGQNGRIMRAGVHSVIAVVDFRFEEPSQSGVATRDLESDALPRLHTHATCDWCRWRDTKRGDVR